MLSRSGVALAGWGACIYSVPVVQSSDCFPVPFFHVWRALATFVDLPHARRCCYPGLVDHFSYPDFRLGPPICACCLVPVLYLTKLHLIS